MFSVCLYTRSREGEREDLGKRIWESLWRNFVFVSSFFSLTKPKRLNSFFLSFQIFLLKSVVSSPCAILNWVQVAPHTPPRLSKRRINDNNGREKKLLKETSWLLLLLIFLFGEWKSFNHRFNVLGAYSSFLLIHFFSNSESLTHRGTMRQCGLSLFSSLFFGSTKKEEMGKNLVCF